MKEWTKTKVGQFFNGMAILLAETVSREPDDPERGWERRESVVLALLPDNERTPFVTWVRVVSRNPMATPGGSVYIDSCSWGDYHASLQEAMASFAMRSKRATQKRDNEAMIRQRGLDDGMNAASWLVDGNTKDPEAVLNRLIKGIDDGDSEILDALPAPRLGGEFADDPTWEDICKEELGHYDSDEADSLLDVYQESFSQGIERKLRQMLEAYATA